jgi:hypothetical protein
MTITSTPNPNLKEPAMSTTSTPSPNSNAAKSPSLNGQYRNGLPTPPWPTPPPLTSDHSPSEWINCGEPMLTPSKPIATAHLPLEQQLQLAGIARQMTPLTDSLSGKLLEAYGEWVGDILGSGNKVHPLYPWVRLNSAGLFWDAEKHPQLADDNDPRGWASISEHVMSWMLSLLKANTSK